MTWTLVIILAVLANIPPAILIFAPKTDAPELSDVIFVLGPPDSARLKYALQLAEDGVSSTVVISASNNGGAGSIQQNRLCTTEQSLEIICARSDPFTTQGEIALINQLAEERDWQSVTLVTGSTHASRVRLYASRCLQADYTVTPAPGSQPPGGYLYEYVYQIFGFVKAVTVTTGCTH